MPAATRAGCVSSVVATTERGKLERRNAHIAHTAPGAKLPRAMFLAGADTSDGLVDYYLCAENIDGVALAGDLAALALHELCQPGVPGGVSPLCDPTTMERTAAPT